MATSKASFNVGDIVKLKSGGPDITVAKVVGETIHTTWFHHKTLKLDTGEFNIALLTKTPSEGTIIKEFFGQVQKKK